MGIDLRHRHAATPAPEWLAVVVTRPKPAPTAAGRPAGLSAPGGSRYGLSALEGELGRLATAGEGTRNDTLMRSAYRAGQLTAGAGSSTPSTPPTSS